MSDKKKPKDFIELQYRYIVVERFKDFKVGDEITDPEIVKELATSRDYDRNIIKISNIRG